MVIDFIGAAVSGMGLRNLRVACARATRTRCDGMCHPSTAGSLVSVVAIGTATESTTVLCATFRSEERRVLERRALDMMACAIHVPLVHLCQLLP